MPKLILSLSMKNKTKGKVQSEKSSTGAKNDSELKSASQPLKKTLFGVEVELLLIDKNGKVVHKADDIIAKVKKSEQQNLAITKECAHNMIELGGLPNVNVPTTIDATLDLLKQTLLVTEQENLMLCPLGTYPGAFSPEMRLTEQQYKAKKIIFGKTKFSIGGRVFGFHAHFALPWGVFDANKKIIKKLVHSKYKETLVRAYNLLIAMDPALTTFMQSSPFYQGEFLGKNARVIVYRGGNTFNYPNGMYADYQEFGALQPYENTGGDLIHSITKRYEQWRAYLKKLEVNFKTYTKHRSILDTAWNPVKVNANGTLEQRGMDMNHPQILISTALVIKYILKMVLEEFIDVVPDDAAEANPFKYKDGKILIPPHSYVRGTLQPLAAVKGLDSPQVLHYAKSLIALAESFMPENRKAFLAPLKEMIEKKKTVSDEIIDDVKKKGHTDFSKPLPQNIAQEIALEHANRLFKETLLTQQQIANLSADN
ncbi:MAG: Glutamate-cysteine ligase family 2 [Parcubacteria group bacterium GW2011_GWA2_44_12]|nr:MAG: Glutamate-cysteine ligase family 2 [Parcubacteria group bacterium GW2011_GWA2_44_12]